MCRKGKTVSCEEAFYRQLRERGFRLTPQREMVLSVMHQTEDFVTAEEIYEGVRAVSSSVDISTVYRTLDLLQDFRVVAVVDPGDGQRRYKLSTVNDRRVHLVCYSCGKVIGAEQDPVLSLAEHLQVQYGFALDLARLSIPGVCEKCGRH